MASTPDIVRIHYHRPPDREDVYVQRLLMRDADCIITFMPKTPMEGPATVGGRVILEDGSPVIWFTFPGRWHDIGRFHTADGRFTGIYANILTPVEHVDSSSWKTTDLFLDVWLDADGSVHTLDEDELDEAVERGWVDNGLAARARDEAARIHRAAVEGLWPPAPVEEWTLERALDLS